MTTTDWELPGMDNATLDQAWTEAAVRRAKTLADDLYESAKRADPAIRDKAEELSSLLYELGIHLDATVGYNITGGDRDLIVPGAALYVRCADCGRLIDHIRFG